MLATTDSALPWGGVADALQRVLRPAVGFTHPADVLKDPDLDAAEKRAILSSWASDASAVEDAPTLRWLFGTERPVPPAEVFDALERLDRRASGPSARRTLRREPRPSLSRQAPEGFAASPRMQGDVFL